MTNVTVEQINVMVENKDRKGIQAVAKTMGIKANGTTVGMAQQIIALLPVSENVEPNADSVEAQFAAMVSGDSASEASATIIDADAPLGDIGDEFIDDAEVNVPATTVEAANEVSRAIYEKPYFEFVKADNCTVEFKQCGVRIIIGWSKKDFKFYIHNDKKGNALYTPYSAINAFKPFKNGEHGDIARIVKALTHIKQKPSIIQAMEKRAKDQQYVSAEPRKENTTTTKPRRSSFVKIDPQWLRGYQEQMGENYDARNVRRDYTAYCEGNVHSGNVAQ